MVSVSQKTFHVISYVQMYCETCLRLTHMVFFRCRRHYSPGDMHCNEMVNRYILQPVQKRHSERPVERKTNIWIDVNKSCANLFHPKASTDSWQNHVSSAECWKWGEVSGVPVSRPPYGHGIRGRARSLWETRALPEEG